MAKTSRPARRKTSRVPTDDAEDLLENPRAQERKRAAFMAMLSPAQQVIFESKTPEQQAELLKAALEPVEDDVLEDAFDTWLAGASPWTRQSYMSRSKADQEEFARLIVKDRLPKLLAERKEERYDPRLIDDATQQLYAVPVSVPKDWAIEYITSVGASGRNREQFGKFLASSADEQDAALLKIYSLSARKAQEDERDQARAIQLLNALNQPIPVGLAQKKKLTAAEKKQLRDLVADIKRRADERDASLREISKSSVKIQKEELELERAIQPLQSRKQPIPVGLAQKQKRIDAEKKRIRDQIDEIERRADFIPDAAVRAGLLSAVPDFVEKPRTRRDPQLETPTRILKAVEKADALEAAIVGQEAEQRKLQNTVDKKLASRSLTAQARGRLALEFQKKLGKSVENIEEARSRLKRMRREIDDELVAIEKKFSGSPMYEALDPFQQEFEAVPQPESDDEEDEERQKALAIGQPSMVAPARRALPLTQFDPETGRAVIRVVSASEREQLINRYIINNDAYEEVTDLKAAKQNVVDIFNDDEQLRGILDDIGANYRGSADPVRLETQIALLQGMVEDGSMSEEQAQAGIEALGPRKADAEKFFYKLREQAIRRRQVLGMPTIDPRTGKPIEPDNYEIGLAYLNRGKDERAVAAGFGKAVRALKRRSRGVDSNGNAFVFDEYIVDKNGDPVLVGQATKYASAPLYSGSIARSRMRVRGTSVADRVWQRLKAVEDNYIRDIEREGGVRRDYASTSRVGLAKQLFGYLVKEYEKYSDSERNLSFTQALSSENIDKQRNAPRDLLRIRDLIAEFNFKLPEWSRARVKLSHQPLQEGGVMWETIVSTALQEGRDVSAQPERLSAEEFESEYGVTTPSYKSQKERTSAGRARKAAEEGRALQTAADPKVYADQVKIIDGKFKKGFIDQARRDVDLANLKKEHNDARKLVKKLAALVIEHRKERGRPVVDPDTGKALPITARDLGLALGAMQKKERESKK
jgi:hypothetical protein